MDIDLVAIRFYRGLHDRDMFFNDNNNNNNNNNNNINNNYENNYNTNLYSAYTKALCTLQYTCTIPGERSKWSLNLTSFEPTHSQ